MKAARSLTGLLVALHHGPFAHTTHRRKIGAPEATRSVLQLRQTAYSFGFVAFEPSRIAVPDGIFAVRYAGSPHLRVS